MGLPKEIIEEFFMRLSVKTLMRFKCVSKYWNSLISDADFRRRYRSQQQSKGKAPTGYICHANHLDVECVERTILFEEAAANKFLYTSENYVKKKELRSLKGLNKFGYVIAASKGLLLLGLNHKSLCVYDLVSDKSVYLPRNLEEWDSVALGFKCEEKSGNLCYKVVCVSNKPQFNRYSSDKNVEFNRYSSDKNVEIYTSETGTWKKSILKAESTCPLLRNDIAKVIGGVFHWREIFNYNRIIAYDSEKGRTTRVELPLFMKNEVRRHNKLKEFEGTKDGSLQLIRINDMMIHVWIVNIKKGQKSYMDEDIVDVSRWSLIRSINLWDICMLFQPKPPRIIGVDPADPHIVYLDMAKRLYAYNHHEEKVEFVSSQRIAAVDVFIHFEWPTWPCL